MKKHQLNLREISCEVLRLLDNGKIENEPKYHIHFAFNIDVNQYNSLDSFSDIYLKPIINKVESLEGIPANSYYESEIKEQGTDVYRCAFNAYRVRVCIIGKNILRIDIGFPEQWKTEA